MKVFESIAQIKPLVGQDVAVSDWITITQQQVNLFAEATGDHQWIHVDVERAQAGPFGAPIAHGFLTLSLIPRFFMMALEIPSRMSINYGLNRVRFTAPVKSGKRVRGRFTLGRLDKLEGNGVQVTWSVTVEIEGEAKPALVAEWIGRHYTS